MKRREVGLLAMLLLLSLSLAVGCANREGEGATQESGPSDEVQQASGASEETPPGDESSEKTQQHVLTGETCLVHHSGYRGTIVARGVSKPTEGTVVSLECNKKNVEISSTEIADGFIETAKFGKIGIRFRSMIATIGAGDFTSVAEGHSLPEWAIEVYVHKSKQEEFMGLFSN